uniref:NTR domain-containing protein n=1 Tax=Schistosoma mansoni TaxID=6183 RepID=A0A5K4FC23_SCHMA
MRFKNVQEKRGKIFHVSLNNVIIIISSIISSIGIDIGSSCSISSSTISSSSRRRSSSSSRSGGSNRSSSSSRSSNSNSSSTNSNISSSSSSRAMEIHDIPCQSTCLSLLSICGQLRNAPQSFFMNIPSSCPNTVQIQTSQKRWIYENNNYQTTLSPIRSTTHYNTYHNRHNSKRYTRYPNYMTYISPRSFLSEDRYGYDHYNNPINRNRYPRQINMNTDLFHSPNQYYTVDSKRSIEYSNHQNLKKMHLPFTPTQRKLPLIEEDCLLLPPGGCDNWMDPSTNLQRLKAPNYREYLKLNLGCPKDIPETCNSMFPTLYTRSKWIKSNFTVSAVIRISGTLWWFGKNDRFQPLFRFHILKTYDSDIHPYDEKMILTYSWPLQCICIDEIIVGKKYLMLTHSFKSRQTLHITKDTVFLSRVRRYTRKLACWKGACTLRSSRNRRRSYNIQSNIKLFNNHNDKKLK